jgi:hypothetical protein
VHQMKHLRERGIYQAPNGQRLVASRERCTTADGRRILSEVGTSVNCFLFSVYQWAFHGAPDFEVTPHGGLIQSNQTTGWHIEELIDTGATAGTH